MMQVSALTPNPSPRGRGTCEPLLPVRFPFSHWDQGRGDKSIPSKKASRVSGLCPLPKSLSQVWERDFECSGSPAPILGVGVGGRGKTWTFISLEYSKRNWLKYSGATTDGC
jgi:hypothetical protein